MSTRYNTGNPIESTDVRDMSDNAKNFDEFSNSQSPNFLDRFGNQRETISGIKSRADSVISQIEIDVANAVEAVGFERGAGDFVTGFTVMPGMRNVAWLNPAPSGDNNLYSWSGEVPPSGKIVPPNSTPETTGGFVNAWVPRTDETLRGELYDAGGAGLVGGIAKPVTWVGFAGGADPTGVALSDAAFAAAEAYDKEVYIPSGVYNLTGSYNGRFTFADGVIFNGVGSAYKKDTGFNASTTGAASITRFNRVFVGDAAYSNDGRAGGTTTWLGKKDYVAPNGSPQPGLTWPERTAQLSSITSQGGGALMGGAHTKELTGGSSQALVGIAVNDNESVLTSCRGMYLDAKRYANSVGPAYAAEMQIANLGTFVDEYANSTQKTFCLSLFSGGDPAINGLTEDVTTALSIANNGSRFGTGITFSSGALRVISEEGLADYGRAMTLRGGHRIGWEDGAGVTRSYINSVISDTTKRVGILFQNGVIDLNGPSTKAFRASGEVGDSAYLRVRSSSQANANVRLEIEGETNCSLSLEAKGTGNIIVNKSIRGNTPSALQCGTAAFPWSTGFSQSAFTITSDENYKSSPEQFTDAMLDAAAEVEWVLFQYLDRIEEKGADGARWHFGAMAQRFIEAFERHGLDPYRFAFICYDEWGDSPELIGEDGEVISPAVAAGSRYGIRYDQAIILKQKQIERDNKRQLDTLLSRIEALENK